MFYRIYWALWACFFFGNYPQKILQYPTRGHSTIWLLSSLPCPTLLEVEKLLLAGACLQGPQGTISQHETLRLANVDDCRVLMTVRCWWLSGVDDCQVVMIDVDGCHVKNEPVDDGCWWLSVSMDVMCWWLSWWWMSANPVGGWWWSLYFALRVYSH